MITKAIAGLLVAAALVAPSASAAGNGSPGTSSPNASNAVLRNDQAHFGARPSGSPAAAAVVVRVDGGFDWVSAGVGAAGAVGFSLVAGVGISGLRRRRQGDLARA
jgi:hypothetical protein